VLVFFKSGFDGTFLSWGIASAGSFGFDTCPSDERKLIRIFRRASNLLMSGRGTAEDKLEVEDCPVSVDVVVFIGR
jgi:hypothetical protein